MSTTSSATRCPQCGAAHSVMRHVCPSCKHDYRRSRPCCGRCQRPLTPGVESCTHCCAPAEPPPEPSPRDVPEPAPQVAQHEHAPDNDHGNELPPVISARPVRRRRLLFAGGTALMVVSLLMTAIVVRSVRARGVPIISEPKLVLGPVAEGLRSSLVAVGQRSGDTVQWRATGVLVSSDGFLLVDQAAWPGAMTNLVAGVSPPSWQGPLLCVLQDADSGLAVLRLGNHAVGVAPPELSTESSAVLTGQVVSFQPDLGDFRAYVLSSAGAAVRVPGPDKTGQASFARPGPLFSAGSRELIAVLGSDTKGTSRAVRADQLQALLVRARAVPSRPCGTVVPLPLVRSVKL